MSDHNNIPRSDFLADRRAKFRDELQKNPGLRDKVAAMMLLEHASDPLPVVESLMNRMDMLGKRLEFGLGLSNPKKSFYGPIREDKLDRAMEELRQNPRLAKRMNDAIDQGLGGSNLLRGFTDQGLPTDPNGQHQAPGGNIVRGNNVYTDFGGGWWKNPEGKTLGGHKASAAYREHLMKEVADEERRKASQAAGAPTAGLATLGGAAAPGVQFASANDPISSGQSTSFAERWLDRAAGEPAANGDLQPTRAAPTIPFASANDPISQGRLSFYDRWSAINDMPGTIPDYLRPYFPQGGSGAGNAQSPGLDIGPPEVLAPLTRPSSQTGSYDGLLRSLFAPDDLSRRVPDNLRRSDAGDGAEPESAASVPIRRLTSRIVQY